MTFSVCFQGLWWGILCALLVQVFFLFIVTAYINWKEEANKAENRVREYADFSQPYTESGMVLIVPIRSTLPNGIWLFLKPFTKEMWGVLVAITIYNGFAVWLIERNHDDEFRSGTVWNQIGTLFWLAFSILFTLPGKKLHTNLSRMAMVVWVFVALIVIHSYTASLASMLTAQRLEPAIKNVETLKKMDATVGYCKWSFLKSYMISALDFKDAKIKKYDSTDAYAKALNSKEIANKTPYFSIAFSFL